MINFDDDGLSETRQGLLTIFGAMTRSWSEKDAAGICFICNKPYTKCKCGKGKNTCGHSKKKTKKKS